jgi:hypothetical protein
VCAKLGYDLVYIERATPWLDVKVFMGTMLKAVPGLSRFCVVVARCGTFLAAADARGTEANAAMIAHRRGVKRAPTPVIPSNRAHP